MTDKANDIYDDAETLAGNTLPSHVTDVGTKVLGNQH